MTYYQYRFEPNRPPSLLREAKKRSWAERHKDVIIPAAIGATALAGLAAVGAYHAYDRHRNWSNINIEDIDDFENLSSESIGPMSVVPSPQLSRQSSSASLGEIVPKFSQPAHPHHIPVLPIDVNPFVASSSSSTASTPRRLDIDQDLPNATELRIDVDNQLALSPHLSPLMTPEPTPRRTPSQSQPISRTASRSTSRSPRTSSPARIDINQDLGVAIGSPSPSPSPAPPPPILVPTHTPLLLPVPPNIPQRIVDPEYERYGERSTLESFKDIARSIVSPSPSKPKAPAYDENELFADEEDLASRLESKSRDYTTSVATGVHARQRIRYDEYAKDYWDYVTGKLGYEPAEPDVPRSTSYDKPGDVAKLAKQDAVVFANIRRMIHDKGYAIEMIGKMTSNPNGNISIYVPEIVREGLHINLVAPSKLAPKKKKAKK